MGSDDFRTGDLVWARMKGFPPWPAKIVDPPADSKGPKNKKSHFVKFFGSENFAWILDEKISLHDESILNTLNKKRSAAFQKAVDDLITCSKNLQEENQNSPAVKKDKIQDSYKATSTKIVKIKIINTVSEKRQRKVFTRQPVHKTYTKKRSLSSNGEHKAYANSRPSKFLKSVSSLGNSVIRNSTSWDDPQMSYFERFLSCSALERKHVEPSLKKFGFIGLGHMGGAIVNNLISSGHDVTVWNRGMHKCNKFEEAGAKTAHSAADLVKECDITFCCVSDPDASKALIFGEHGILKGLEEAEKSGRGLKGYVEMTSIDPDTSLEINEAINMKRALYLEATLCGTSKHAENGSLIILTSGDRRLFSECETCFHAIGEHAYYLTCDVGYASKMNLILSTMSSSICALMSEAMVLAERFELDKIPLLKAIRHGPLNPETVMEKFCKMYKEGCFSITALTQMQKDIELGLAKGDEVSQPMPIHASVNEIYKIASQLDLSPDETMAVIETYCT